MRNSEIPESDRSERIRRLRRELEETGSVNPDPESDPDYLARLNQANLSQTESSTPSPDNPWEPLPRSMDHDPDLPAQHLPRVYRGKPRNQIVGSQGTLDAGKKKRVMSAISSGREMTKPQPIERGRLGTTSPADRQKAAQQRHEIREDMEKRGEL